MTTVAYVDGKLAFDELVTVGTRKVGGIRKGRVIGPYLMAGSGDADAV